MTRAERHICAALQIAPTLPVLEDMTSELAAIIVLHSLAQMLTHELLLPGEAMPLEHGQGHQVVLMGVVAGCCV